MDELDDKVNGEATEVNPAEQAQAQAETSRAKALKRARERNSARTFADDDDEALYGAMNEDAEADAEELGRYRQDSEDLDNFLRGNPRGAQLLSSMRRDGNPYGQLVEDYGEDMVRSLDDPAVRKTIKEAEARRLEKIAKDEEFQAQYDENLKKSAEARQQLIDEGLDQEQVDGAIKEIIDNAVRQLSGDISADDIRACLDLKNMGSSIEEARRQGEVKGRNANIQKEMSKRAKSSDGIPSFGGQGASVDMKKKEDKSGALGRVSGRPSIWDR